MQVNTWSFWAGLLIQLSRASCLLHLPEGRFGLGPSNLSAELPHSARADTENWFEYGYTDWANLRSWHETCLIYISISMDAPGASSVQVLQGRWGQVEARRDQKDLPFIRFHLCVSTKLHPWLWFLPLNPHKALVQRGALSSSAIELDSLLPCSAWVWE